MDNDNVSYTEEARLPFMYGRVDDTVNVPRNEYEELVERSAWLSALEAAGVDNWEGKDTAQTIYDERNENVEQS